MALFSSISFRCMTVLTLLALNPWGIHVRAAPQLHYRQDSGSGLILGPNGLDGPAVNCSSKLSNDPELSTKSRNYTDCDDVVNRVNLIAPGGNYTLEQFFSANPEIKPKCTNLVQDYDYCVNAIRPADSESFPPIPQTTIGDPSFLTNPNCSEYRPLAANDTCDALGAQYKFNEDQLIFLNPQTSCSSLTPGEFVCVRPLSVMVYPAGMSAYISRLPFVNNDGLTTPNSLSFVPGIPSATSTFT